MDRKWSVGLLVMFVLFVLGATSAEAQSRRRRHHRRHPRAALVTHAAVRARETPPTPSLASPPPAAAAPATLPVVDAPAAPLVPTAPPACPPTEPLQLPAGRAIADLSADACLALLTASGIAFDALTTEDAPAVRTPVRVRGPIGGVVIAPRNDPQRSPHAIVDCRLALALLAWAPTLRAAHIVKIEHYSAYRANARIGGRGPVSGHASAMALDAALFHTDDGKVLDVLVDWADRVRGADPCTPRLDETARSHILRTLVCEAVRADLFQVVLTPHHDAAHQNHVHLELRPGVTWSFVK